MRVEEAAGGALAELAQRLERLVVGVERAAPRLGLAQILHHDAMEAQPAKLARPRAARQAALVDEAVDECDPAQFRQQRGVEADLVHAAHDLAAARRHLAALARIDLHDQHVLGRGRAQKRDHCRIAAVAAVPVRHAVDLDGAEQQRQRGRGHHHLGRDLGAREDAELAGLHVGRRDEQLAPPIVADRLEVDEALDQLLERIDVERVEVIGREQARHRAEPQILARQKREQALHHVALQVGQVAIDAHRAPEIGEPLARFVRSATGEAVRQHDRVHRAGRRAGDALDAAAAVHEQLIEHAPGEGAVGAAALQREVERFGAVWPGEG